MRLTHQGGADPYRKEKSPLTNWVGDGGVLPEGSGDEAGYSRLMGVDEEATHKTLRAYREIIDGLIARHDGRIFGTAGDSVVAEFASPVEAVRH